MQIPQPPMVCAGYRAQTQIDDAPENRGVERIVAVSRLGNVEAAAGTAISGSSYRCAAARDELSPWLLLKKT
jgi:hypothetical protein